MVQKDCDMCGHPRADHGKAGCGYLGCFCDYKANKYYQEYHRKVFSSYLKNISERYRR